MGARRCGTGSMFRPGATADHRVTGREPHGQSNLDHGRASAEVTRPGAPPSRVCFMQGWVFGRRAPPSPGAAAFGPKAAGFEFPLAMPIATPLFPSRIPTTGTENFLTRAN